MQESAPDQADTTRTAPAATPLALVKHLRAEGFTVIDAARHESLGQVGTGRQPHAVARHPGGRWAYTPYMGSNTLEVFDLQQLTVDHSYDDIGTAPVGATLTNDGAYLLVTTYGGLPNWPESGIAVFETLEDGRLRLVEELPLGKAAGVVTDVRNDVWVALKDASVVVRLDGQPPFEELDRFKVPGDPQDVRYEPAYGLLSVNNVADGSVSFVDTLDHRHLATVPAPNPRDGTPVTAVDRWFIGNTEGDGVTVIDLDAVRRADTDSVGDATTQRSDASIRLADATTQLKLGTPTAFSDVRPDGRLLVVDAYEDDRVTFLDPSTLDIVDRVRTGGTPHHPRFSADGRVCYVPNQETDTVSVLDTATRGQDDPAVSHITDIPLPDGAAPSGCFRTDRR